MGAGSFLKSKPRTETPDIRIYIINVLGKTVRIGYDRAGALN